MQDPYLLNRNSWLGDFFPDMDNLPCPAAKDLLILPVHLVPIVTRLTSLGGTTAVAPTINR